MLNLINKTGIDKAAYIILSDFFVNRQTNSPLYH